MANKIVIEGTNLTASQMKEFWGQVETGTINKEVMQAFIEHRDPWAKSTPAVNDKFKEMIAAGTMIVHRGVVVNRNRTPQEAIAATGRKQYVDDKAVASMPRGQGEVVDLYYVKANRFLSDDNLEKWMEELGLTFDPRAQAADNEANPTFADDYPNGAQWKNSKGEWCFSAFNRWDDERLVDIYRHGFGWNGSWWFPGSQVAL